MTAGTAGLSVLGLFCLAFVLCVMITAMSIWFQRMQDRRFARPMARGSWGWLADAAILWRTVIKRRK